MWSVKAELSQTVLSTEAALLHSTTLSPADKAAQRPWFPRPSPGRSDSRGPVVPRRANAVSLERPQRPCSSLLGSSIRLRLLFDDKIRPQLPIENKNGGARYSSIG